MSTLIEIPDPAAKTAGHYNEHYVPAFNSTLDSYCFQWAKACTDTTQENTYIQMQGLVTCKDYVVDAYFRPDPSVRLFKKSLWTEEQLSETCFIISLPRAYSETSRKQMLNNANTNINTVLRQVEEKLGFTPTKLIPLTKSFYSNTEGSKYIITGDNRWGYNATTISVYLSLIRLCIYKGPMKEFNADRGEQDLVCNEMQYTKILSHELKTYLYKVWSDPTELFVPFPKKYHQNTGWSTVVGHGATGLFAILGYIQKVAPNKEGYTPNTYVVVETKKSFFAHKIYEQVYGEKLSSIKGRSSHDW